jgi:hypothetical protein
MRWQDYRRSDNVEEGSSSGPSMFGGGLRLSGGAIILVVVVSLLLGKNPLEMLALLTGDGGGTVVQTQALPGAGAHALSRSNRHGLRIQQRGGRPVLLSRGPQGLPRLEFFPGVVAALRRTRRFRAGVCDRP